MGGRQCSKREGKKNCFLFSLFIFFPLSGSLSLSTTLSFKTAHTTTKTKMSSEQQQQDPFALHADGSAVDPRAFRAAALADASLAGDLEKDERASSVLASGDDAALQELLKEVHQVRCSVYDGSWRERGKETGKEAAN